MNINSKSGIYLRDEDMLIYFDRNNYKAAYTINLSFFYQRGVLNNYNIFGFKAITSFVNKNIKRK